MMKRFGLLLFMAFVVTSCAHVISETTLKEVDINISFADLKSNAAPFIGKKVLLGGKVAEVRNLNGEGQMEIVQFPLDKTGFPIEAAISAGRFIATSPGLIDPDVYKKTRLVTLVGEIKGQKKGTVDGAGYVFPVLGIKEIFAWKMDLEGNEVRTLPPSYYNPYDYSHDVPMWYRPSGPVFRQ